MSEALTPPELPAPKRSRLRFLRLAASVFFGLLAVALVVLWVRSYWREYELVAGHVGFETRVATARGVVGFFAEKGRPRLDFYSRVVNELQERYLAECTILGFGFPQATPPRGIFLPTWFIMLGSAFASMKLFQNQVVVQFSLRTLLIATMLVAFILGLVAWMVR